MVEQNNTLKESEMAEIEKKPTGGMEGFDGRHALGSYFLYPDLYIPKDITKEEVEELRKRIKNRNVDQKVLDARNNNYWGAQESAGMHDLKTLPIIPWEGEEQDKEYVTYLEQFPHYLHWKERNATYFQKHPEVIQALPEIFKQLGVHIPQSGENAYLSSIHMARMYRHYYWSNNENPKGEKGLNLLISELIPLCSSNENGMVVINKNKLEELSEAIMAFSGILGDDTIDPQMNITLRNLISQSLDIDEIIEFQNKEGRLSKDKLSPVEQKLLEEYKATKALPIVLAYDTLTNRQATKELLIAHDTSYTDAPPGAGKTSGISTVWYNDVRREQNPDLGIHDKLFLMQATQTMTSAAAERLSYLLHKNLGEQVGFVHGALDMHKPEIEDIRVMTDGMLMPSLVNIYKNGVGELNKIVGEHGVLTLFFDEIHKKSPTQAFNIFIAQELQKMESFREIFPEGERSRIRIIFATGTTAPGDPEKLGVEPNAKMEVKSQNFRVNNIWGKAESGETRASLLKRSTEERNNIIANDIFHILTQFENNPEIQNILVFFSGKGPIEVTKKKILEHMKSDNASAFFKSIIDILEIHGGTTIEEQKKVAALKVKKGERIVYLSTNAAEAGKTFPDTNLLIDTDTVKRVYYEYYFGANVLEEEEITRFEKKQRDLRVGRNQDGIVVSPYSLANDHLELAPTEESKRILCVKEVLNLLYLDFTGPKFYEALNRMYVSFDPDLVQQTLYELGPDRLGAISEASADGKITEAGEVIRTQPVEPILAKALYEAKNSEVAEAVATIVAVLNSMGEPPLFEEVKVGTTAYNNRIPLMEKIRKEIIANRGRGNDFMQMLGVWREYERIVGPMLIFRTPKTEEEKAEQELKKAERLEKITKFCEEYGASISIIQGTEELKLRLAGARRGTWQEDLEHRKSIEKIMARAFKGREFKRKDQFSFLMMNNPVRPPDESMDVIDPTGKMKERFSGRHQRFNHEPPTGTLETQHELFNTTLNINTCGNNIVVSEIRKKSENEVKIEHGQSIDDYIPDSKANFQNATPLSNF